MAPYPPSSLAGGIITHCASFFLSVPPDQVRCVEGNQDHFFALKRLRKDHVVQKHQQEHVLMEKRVLQESRCPFIVRWGILTLGLPG